MQRMECFGDYMHSDRCRSCQVGMACSDLAIELDGYYDEQARKEEWWQAIELDASATAGDARIRPSMPS